MFQSLIGELKTKKIVSIWNSIYLFQSLIGELKTYLLQTGLQL